MWETRVREGETSKVGIQSLIEIYGQNDGRQHVSLYGGPVLEVYPKNVLDISLVQIYT